MLPVRVWSHVCEAWFLSFHELIWVCNIEEEKLHEDRRRRILPCREHFTPFSYSDLLQQTYTLASLHRDEFLIFLKYLPIYLQNVSVEILMQILLLLIMLVK